MAGEVVKATKMGKKTKMDGKIEMDKETGTKDKTDHKMAMVFYDLYIRFSAKCYYHIDIAL